MASSFALPARLIELPGLSLRFVPVWRRNLLVWRKLAFASILGNIADPLLYMLALGYGLGALVGDVGGMPYVAFIGTGMVCQSAMFTASFEGMYSAFSRMHVQRTWEGIINAPIALDDVVLAEWVWTGTKAVMSTTAILAVILALGFGHTWLALWILPLGFLVGLVFGAFGLVMNALAPGYDFFTYFFTLVITPMLLLSGVYFPVEQMPGWLATAATVLPLKHAIDIARPLMLARVPDGVVLHLAGLREAGWQGNPRIAGLGYTASCALRWGIVGLWWLRSLGDSGKETELETHWNRPLPQLASQWGKTFLYIQGLTEEAYQLQQDLF